VNCSLLTPRGRLQNGDDMTHRLVTPHIRTGQRLLENKRGTGMNPSLHVRFRESRSSAGTNRPGSASR
jgi:hypothetical protein